MEACTSHKWKELYHSPRGESSRTSVMWCETCGTVEMHYSYFELMQHHKETHTPQSMQSKS